MIHSDTLSIHFRYTFDTLLIHSDQTLFLGGHPDEKQSADVFISNFEVYSKAYKSETEPNYILPEEISTLIDGDYQDRIG